MIDEIRDRRFLSNDSVDITPKYLLSRISKHEYIYILLYKFPISFYINDNFTTINTVTFLSYHIVLISISCITINTLSTNGPFSYDLSIQYDDTIIPFQCIIRGHCVHLAAWHQDRVQFTLQSTKEFKLHPLREWLMVRLRPVRRSFAIMDTQSDKWHLKVIKCNVHRLL